METSRYTIVDLKCEAKNVAKSNGFKVFTLWLEIGNEGTSLFVKGVRKDLTEDTVSERL